ncbi:MAG: hypothetical protein NVS3B10_03830 [Polyangiales bacterium]
MLIAIPRNQTRENVPDPPLVAAASGRRQELAFFNDRDAAGALRQDVRVFDFDLGAETRRAFVSKDRPSDPVAVTYRAEDDAYYMLDRVLRKHGKRTTVSLRLLRLPRGLTVEPVVEWPIDDDLIFFGLTTGADGTLVLSGGWSRRHAIAVLRLLPDGTLGFAGGWRGARPFAVAAYRGLDGTFFVPPPKSGSGPLRPLVVGAASTEETDDHQGGHGGDHDGEQPDPTVVRRLQELFE